MFLLSPSTCVFCWLFKASPFFNVSSCHPLFAGGLWCIWFCNWAVINEFCSEDGFPIYKHINSRKERTAKTDTLPETNVAPGRRPSRKETHLPTLVFQVLLCQFQVEHNHGGLEDDHFSFQKMDDL